MKYFIAVARRKVTIEHALVEVEANTDRGALDKAPDLARGATITPWKQIGESCYEGYQSLRIARREIVAKAHDHPTA